MGAVGFGVVFILSALALSVDLVAVYDVWPDVDGGFLAGGLLQTSRLSKIGPSLLDPFPIWNMIDLQSSFDLRLMNSSWSGPAKTNIYRKGESVYLQVFASDGLDQALFIQSCYATPSSDPMAHPRSALVLNKGCVSSKQPAVEFISRQRDSINLLLNTSSLKFLQLYVHCSVVFSSAVTPDTKSCNFNKSTSSWVELNGQMSVCECCASKCKGPPSYGGPSNELKALVSSGLLTIKEEQHEEPSLSNSLNSTFQVGSSTAMNRTGSGTFPSSVEKGWIVASATVSANSIQNVPYSSPWLAQPVLSDSVLVVSQDPGSALSLSLPRLFMDVAPYPVLKVTIDIPQVDGTARLFGVSGQDGTPTDDMYSDTTSEEVQDWKSLIPERVSEVYMADSPGLRDDWDLGDLALEGFDLPDEELRGDVFMNYKWPQHDDLPDYKLDGNAVVSPLLEKLPEKVQERDEMTVLKPKEKVVKVKGDEFGKLEYVKKTTLTFSQASDGSSSLGYEEEERSPSVGEQEVKKSKLELERRKVDEEGSSKEVEKDLMQRLMDVLRDLNKMMTEE